MATNPFARMRGLSLMTLASVALLTTSACGTSKTSSTAHLTPDAALHAAEASVSNDSALTVTFKVDGTASQLMALSTSGHSGKALTQSQAEAIVGGSIVIAAQTNGGTFGQQQQSGAATRKGSFSLDVNSGTAPNLVQLVYTGGNLYVRADVAQLIAYAGSKASALSRFTGPNVPPQFGFIKNAIAGQWLELPVGELLSLAKGIRPSAVPSAGPGQISALRHALASVLARDVQVTRGSADSQLGDHLILTGSTRTIVGDTVTALMAQASSIPGIGSALTKFDASKVPDKTVSVDVYVKNGVLSSVRLDLSQFMNTTEKAALGGQPFALELDYAPTASISAPANAVTVNLSALLGGLIGAGSGLGGSSSAPLTSSG